MIYERTDRLDFLKIKTFVLWKTMSKEWKEKPLTGWKYLQKTYDTELSKFNKKVNNLI